jgi:hypothetical protein
MREKSKRFRPARAYFPMTFADSFGKLCGHNTKKQQQ